MFYTWSHHVADLQRHPLPNLKTSQLEFCFLEFYIHACDSWELCFNWVFGRDLKQLCCCVCAVLVLSSINVWRFHLRVCVRKVCVVLDVVSSVCVCCYVFVRSGILTCWWGVDVDLHKIEPPKKSHLVDWFVVWFHFFYLHSQGVIALVAFSNWFKVF
jgi:hypothetical protein